MANSAEQGSDAMTSTRYSRIDLCNFSAFDDDINDTDGGSESLNWGQGEIRLTQT